MLNTQKRLTGFFGLRELMKGRKANCMKAPVSAYMSKPTIYAGAMSTMREIERLLYRHRIGHLPIVEGGELLGLVTREDYLEYRKRGVGGKG